MTEEDVSNKEYTHLSMELLGDILHFSKSGRLIVKIDNYKPFIKPGQNISDNQGKKIGKISEITRTVNPPMHLSFPLFRKEINYLEQKFTFMKI